MANDIHEQEISVAAEGEMILQILGAADGGRLKQSQLSRKLRQQGSSYSYLRRTTALLQLEAAGRICREARGHDSRGFCRLGWTVAP
jgi:hypothetical protein